MKNKITVADALKWAAMVATAEITNPIIEKLFGKNVNRLKLSNKDWKRIYQEWDNQQSKQL